MLYWAWKGSLFMVVLSALIPGIGIGTVIGDLI
jgi:hypothetical protein